MSLFPEWEAEQPTPPPSYPTRIKAMWQLHGKCMGQTCGGCIHLIGLHYNKTFWKCDLSTMTHGPGTDWRKGWTACGKFEAGTGETHLMCH
jgi:hypothetical protein